MQGVYYRAHVAKNAHKAGFNGYVKNLEDGRVEAAVSCESSETLAFKKILKKGSLLSRVKEIEEVENSETFANGFEVRK